MNTFFFGCKENMSHLMLDMHKAGHTIISCRGAKLDGVQGYNISYI